MSFLTKRAFNVLIFVAFFVIWFPQIVYSRSSNSSFASPSVTDSISPKSVTLENAEGDRFVPQIVIGEVALILIDCFSIGWIIFLIIFLPMCECEEMILFLVQTTPSILSGFLLVCFSTILNSSEHQGWVVVGMVSGLVNFFFGLVAWGSFGADDTDPKDRDTVHHVCAFFSYFCCGASLALWIYFSSDLYLVAIFILVFDVALAIFIDLSYLDEEKAGYLFSFMISVSSFIPCLTLSIIGFKSGNICLTNIGTILIIAVSCLILYSKVLRGYDILIGVLYALAGLSCILFDYGWYYSVNSLWIIGAIAGILLVFYIPIRSVAKISGVRFNSSYQGRQSSNYSQSKKEKKERKKKKEKKKEKKKKKEEKKEKEKPGLLSNIREKDYQDLSDELLV
ncbi:hypothetical protein ADUPG1_013338 [Aduncisulcus paluster]|uniref:DUF4203 domain-containing protein n=1 Tax=Aduncisulcus paluster TaxID=2918883 RepID=A0ABQ5K2M4_9EUKA|nr:hypothetical protein ADUPG1_013338 [Aduncisulcus paluster]